MPSLKKLKLTKCNIKLVSPFLVSKLDEKYLKSRLEVIAIGNWSLDAFDVKKMLAATEELTIIVSSRRDGWNCVSELSSCPHCKETNSTAYWNEGTFQARIQFVHVKKFVTKVSFHWTMMIIVITWIMITRRRTKT